MSIVENTWKDSLSSELNDIKMERVHKFRDSYNTVSFTKYTHLVEYLNKNKISKDNIIKITTDKRNNPILIYSK